MIFAGCHPSIRFLAVASAVLTAKVRLGLGRGDVMITRNWLGALAFAAALAGCASAPPSPLSLSETKSLRLDSVNVSVAPDAAVSWAGAEEDLYGQKQAAGLLQETKAIETGSVGLNGDPNAIKNSAIAELAKSPEGKAYINERIADRLGTALEQTLKPSLQMGSRAVKLEVTVHQFSIPTAAQRVIIGGMPVIKASAVLKDAATGAMLAQRPEMISAAYAGNGWAGVLADQFGDDLDVRLVNSYSAQYKDWLVPPQG